MRLFFSAWILIPATLGCVNLSSKPDQCNPEQDYQSTTTTTPLCESKKGVPYNVTFTGLGIATGQIDPCYPDVIVLRSIPFSKPPVGEYRFSAPRLESDWSNYTNTWMPDSELPELDATRYSPKCWEPKKWAKYASQNSTLGTHEDCLYLDIYIPKAIYEANDKKLPIYVYFHGGAFLAGWNSLINGSHIASTQNIMVIAPNYRLGIFGFWAHPDFEAKIDPELSAKYNMEYDTSKPFIGNQALLDQQMAIIWVRENVASLRGDPNRITIGGGSAGGQSVIAHSVMKSSEPLFDKMLSYSGPNGIPYFNSTSAPDSYEQIAANLQCCNHITRSWGICEGGVNKNCMLNKPPDEIMKEAWDSGQVKANLLNSLCTDKPAMLAEPYQPTWNTAVLERMPYDHMINGEIHDKPFYIGTADNEGWEFVAAIERWAMTWDGILTWVFGLQGNLNWQLWHYYFCDSDDCQPVESKFLTDYIWYCNIR